MNYVLFYVKTGEKINVYDSDENARNQMRNANADAGFTRVKQSWLNGCELEWCQTINKITNAKSYRYGPYGFTEYHRWANGIL